MKKVWLLVPLTLLLGLAAFYRFAPSVAKTSAVESQDWQLRTLTGESKKLSDFRGQVVLLNFWATWCGTCRDEMPDIVKIYQKFHPQGFTVLSVDYDEATDLVTDFVRAYGMDFPVFLDPGKEVAGRYQVVTIPTSFLLDRGGNVRNVGPGAIDPPKLESAISTLLAEPAQ